MGPALERRPSASVVLVLVALAASVLFAACGDAGMTAAHEADATASAPAATPAPVSRSASPATAGSDTIVFVKGSVSGAGYIATEGIYSIGSDGAGLAPLVKGPWLRSPAWSPDGDKIAYIEGFGVCVMDADGSGKRCVTKATSPDDRPDWLTWSADGKRLVFTQGCDLYAIDADGSGRELLVHGEQDLGRPACAPYGRIFFARGDGEVCSVNPDGSDLAVIRRTSDPSSLALSPDGTWLLLWSGDCLMRVPAAGAPARSRLVLESVSSRAGACSFFALASSWSSDGRRIAFAADQSAWIAPSHLCVADADGSHVQRIPHAGLGWNPVWRPE